RRQPGADGRGGDGPEPRGADAERQRLVHLHASGQLQRERQLHLQGQRRAGGLEIGNAGGKERPGERGAAGGERQLRDGRGQGTDDQGRRGAGERRGRRPPGAVGGGGDGAEPRGADAERQRLVHLHAGRELQWERQLHLQGQRRAGGLERGDGGADDQPSERRSRGGQRQLRDGRGHGADGHGPWGAGQRHGRRQPGADGGGGDGPESRSADARSEE